MFLRPVGHSRCHLNKKSKLQVQKQVALVLLVVKETGAWCFLSEIPIHSHRVPAAMSRALCQFTSFNSLNNHTEADASICFYWEGTREVEVEVSHSGWDPSGWPSP